MQRVCASLLTIVLLVGTVGCGGQIGSSQNQTDAQKAEIASKAIKMSNPIPPSTSGAAVTVKGGRIVEKK